jgi:formylglycine-generating enzyme
MKKLLTAFFIMIAVTLLMANHAPRVEDINFSQRDDGSYIVDIYYNVFDQDGDLLTITIFASNDGGQTWNFPMSTYSGDYGANITPGSNKHIVWDFEADHPDQVQYFMKFRIKASDGHDQPTEEIDWAEILAGPYLRGQADVLDTLDYNYEIMVYQVTNAQYLEFLAEELEIGDVEVIYDASLVPVSISGYYIGDDYYPEGQYEFYELDDAGNISWDGYQLLIDEGYEDHPVMEVSWFGANAFAEHYGWRLPTEYEWEKAARGMTGYEYPWGDILSYDRANYNGSGDPWENADTETTPVGFYNGQLFEGFQTTDSPSPYGCYDMCGNVYDWTSSWYGGSYYNRRVLRGGSWYHYYSHDVLRSWYRSNSVPTSTSYSSGFRCARTLP